MASAATPTADRMGISWPSMAVPMDYAKYGTRIATKTASQFVAGAASIPVSSAIRIAGGALIGAGGIVVGAPLSVAEAAIKTPLAIVEPPLTATKSVLKRGWEIVRHPIKSTRAALSAVFSGAPRWVAEKAKSAFSFAKTLDFKGAINSTRGKIGNALAKVGNAAQKTRNYLRSVVHPSAKVVRTVAKALVAPVSSEFRGKPMGLRGVVDSFRNGFRWMFDSFSIAKNTTPRPAFA